MASIDDRVVSITFDNAAFEKNVQRTLSTLATLKSSLDFSGTGASLSEVSEAAGRFSLSGIGEAVDGIASKFSAMGAVAFSVINNITTKAVDAGIQLAKAFTIDPVNQGFDEFELKMGSIQTIMAGSGESLDTVNRKLEELNRYSDQTIYSFADMTQNIGKFTNAGVSLDDSVAAIQGVANVAAISGANAEEASRAMYNFGQALGSGSVKLMDWKSIELANMATVEFKTELLESAVAAGTLTKSADGMYATLEGTPITATQGFNESLSEQWLTAEALTETLGRYSDTSTDIGARATAAASDIKTFSQMMSTLKESAGSGWAQSFELIIGDFEEGKKLFSEIGGALSDMINASADARNDVLTIWKDGGGRALLIDSLREAIKSLGEVIAPVKEAFREVFPATTGRDLLTMTVAFSKFVEKLKPGAETIKNLKSVFLGVFSAVKIVIEVIKGVFSIFTNLFGLFAGSSSGTILAFFAKIGDAVNALRIALVDGGGIAAVFENINKAISKFAGVFIEGLGNVLWLAKSVASFFSGGFNNDLFTGVHAEKLGGFRDAAYRAGEAVASLVEKFKAFFSSLDFSAVSKAIDAFKSSLETLFTGKDGKEGVVPSAAGESVSRFAAVLSALAAVASAVVDAFKTMLSGLGKVGSFLGNLGSAISDALGAVWETIASSIGGGTPKLDDIFKVLAGGGIAAIAAALVKFAKDGFKLDFGQLDVLDELADTLNAVTGSIKAMQKDIIAGALLKIAVAIGVLTLSLIALSFIDGMSLAKSMTAVSAGLALLVGAMAGLDKVASGEGSAAKIALLAVAMAAVAGAMLLLAMAASLMATTDPVALSIGLLGMITSLTMIADVMERLTEDTDGMVKAAFSVGVLSVSLLILAAAVRAWMALDMLSMSIAIFAISASLTIISETMGTMPADGMVKAATSIGILSVALIILAFAIKQMSDIGLVDAATGLATMAVSLKLIGDVLEKMAKPDIMKAGVAILLMSLGISKMATGIEKLGSLDIMTLVKGLGALVVVFKVLGKAMDATKQSLGSAGAMLLVAASIYVLSVSLEKIGAIPFWDLAKGIGVVVVAIAAMSGLATLLAPAVPILAGLGTGLALVGLAALAFGAGIFLMANGIGVLAKVGPSGVKTFLESLDDILRVLPKIAAAFGEAAFEFVTSFLSGFDELIPLVVDLIGQLLDAITELRPKIQTFVIDTITMLLESIRTLYPEFVATGWGILLAFLQGIEDNIGELASTAIGIVTNFINAMAEGIPDYVRAMVNLFTTVMTTMAFELGLLMTTLGPSLGIAFIDGLLTGIKQTVQLIQDFFGEWAGQILDFIKGLFGINSPSLEFASIGIDLILGLLKGILDTIGQVASFFGTLLSDILGWIGNAAVTLISKGVDLMVGFWNGIVSMITTVNNFFMLLPFTILGWIGDVIESLLQTGKNLIIGLLNGAKFVWETVKDWVTLLPERLLGYLGKPLNWLLEAGKDVIRGLWNGIESMKDWIWEKAGQVAGWVKDPISSAAGFLFGSPSKVMFQYGQWVGEGLANGIDDTKTLLNASGLGMSKAVIDAYSVDPKELTTPMQAAVSAAVDLMQDMHEFDGPVITPVLDMTRVQKDAKSLTGLLNTNANLTSALGISSATNATAASTDVSNGPTEIKYEQNIHAPTALSTADIYRQTRSLIALTKEEVNIP